MRGPHILVCVNLILIDTENFDSLLFDQIFNRFHGQRNDIVRVRWKPNDMLFHLGKHLRNTRVKNGHIVRSDLYSGQIQPRNKLARLLM